MSVALAVAAPPPLSPQRLALRDAIESKRVTERELARANEALTAALQNRDVARRRLNEIRGAEPDGMAAFTDALASGEVSSAEALTEPRRAWKDKVGKAQADFDAWPEILAACRAKVEGLQYELARATTAIERAAAEVVKDEFDFQLVERKRHEHRQQMLKYEAMMSFMRMRNFVPEELSESAKILCITSQHDFEKMRSSEPYIALAMAISVLETNPSAPLPTVT
jgi:hypothetical protein